jgi:hypothetical protein
MVSKGEKYSEGRDAMLVQQTSCSEPEENDVVEKVKRQAVFSISYVIAETYSVAKRDAEVV